MTDAAPEQTPVDLDALKAAVNEAVDTFENVVKGQAEHFAEASEDALNNLRDDINQAFDDATAAPSQPVAPPRR